MKLLRRFVLISLAFAMTLVRPECVLACAVCFGDPNSDMVKGANAGILILLGIIITVLGAIGSVALFWMRRARLYHRTLLARQAMEALEGPVMVDLPAVNGRFVAASSEA